MKTTALEKSMILAIAHSLYTQHNGAPIDSADESRTFAWDIVETSADQGVFSSLIKKGLVLHSGEGNDSICELSEAGFEVYLQVREAKKTTYSDTHAAALNSLVSMVSRGVEYPDAHSSVCLKYGVDGDSLTEAYDNL